MPGAGWGGVIGIIVGAGEKTGLEGMPQRHPIPASVQPFIRTVRITAGVTVRANNMYNELADALSTALGGPGAIGSIIANMIDHTGSTVSKNFRVKDWPKDFKIDGGFLMTGGSAGTVTGLKCDGMGGDWHLTNGSGSMDFTLNDDGVGQMQGADGPVTVRLEMNGDSAKLVWTSNYVHQELPVQPGDFCDN